MMFVGCLLLLIVGIVFFYMATQNARRGALEQQGEQPGQTLPPARVEPMLRAAEQDMTLGPWIDPEDFNPGYLMRGMHLLPKRGTTRDWLLPWSRRDRSNDPGHHRTGPATRDSAGGDCPRFKSLPGHTPQ